MAGLILFIVLTLLLAFFIVFEELPWPGENKDRDNFLSMLVLVTAFAAFLLVLAFIVVGV